MKTEFTVEGMTVLPDGQVVIAGVSRGPILRVSQRGAGANGSLKVEIASVAIVDPPPEDPSKQMLSLRMLKGDSSQINGMTLIFETGHYEPPYQPYVG